MSSLQCLLYMSQATRAMSPAEIDRLLQGARERNRLRGITGALLYYDGRFVQVLEGEAAAVEQCFALIQTDPRHEQVTALHRGPIEAAGFPEWSMRYVSLDGPGDRAVAAFLDQLQRQPTPETVKQAITLLRRLASTAAESPAH